MCVCVCVYICMYTSLFYHSFRYKIFVIINTMYQSISSFIKNLISVSWFRLQENGQTALGPALLVSIVLAGKIPGSKVRIISNN